MKRTGLSGNSARAAVAAAARPSAIAQMHRQRIGFLTSLPPSFSASRQFRAGQIRSASTGDLGAWVSAGMKRLVQAIPSG